MIRMGTNMLTRSHWLVYFQYLIGIDGRIKYAKGIYRMISADCVDYVKAFNLARSCQIEFLRKDEIGTIQRPVHSVK